jgi:hypothetical protein
MNKFQRQLLKTTSWNGDRSHRRGSEITIPIYNEKICASDDLIDSICGSCWLLGISPAEIFCANFPGDDQGELWTQVWQSKSSFRAALDAWECSGLLIGWAYGTWCIRHLQSKQKLDSALVSRCILIVSYCILIVIILIILIIIILIIASSSSSSSSSSSPHVLLVEWRWIYVLSGSYGWNSSHIYIWIMYIWIYYGYMESNPDNHGKPPFNLINHFHSIIRMRSHLVTFSQLVATFTGAPQMCWWKTFKQIIEHVHSNLQIWWQELLKIFKKKHI